jgi:hypothetical protein
MGRPLMQGGSLFCNSQFHKGQQKTTTNLRFDHTNKSDQHLALKAKLDPLNYEILQGGGCFTVFFRFFNFFAVRVKQNDRSTH